MKTVYQKFLESLRGNEGDKFQKAALHVLQLEGDYSNDPYDYGGETKYGIAKKYYPDLDIKNLTLEQALQIYKRDYWDVFWGDRIQSQEICTKMLDIALNMGPSRAIRFLQDALNHVDKLSLAVDGIMGPETLRAVNSSKRLELVLKVLNCLQFERYHEIVHRDPSQVRFFNGWMRRVSL